MSERRPGGAASGLTELGALQKEGQPLGHSVQVARACVPEEVAFPHKIVLQEVLAHTLVQFPHQAQEGFAEDPPVPQVGVFLASPKEHRLWKQEVVSDIVPGHGREFLRKCYRAHMALEGGRRESPRAGMLPHGIMIPTLRWALDLLLLVSCTSVIVSVTTDISSDPHSP